MYLHDFVHVNIIYVQKHQNIIFTNLCWVQDTIEFAFNSLEILSNILYNCYKDMIYNKKNVITFIKSEIYILEQNKTKQNGQLHTFLLFLKALNSFLNINFQYVHVNITLNSK